MGRNKKYSFDHLNINESEVVSEPKLAKNVHQVVKYVNRGEKKFKASLKKGVATVSRIH